MKKLFTEIKFCERLETSKGTNPNDRNKKIEIEKMKIHQVGAKVKGEYYGEKYSGVVTYGRPHTMNDSYLHFVKLDAPIIVFGAERDAIVITSGKENTIFAL